MGSKYSSQIRGESENNKRRNFFASSYDIGTMLVNLKDQRIPMKRVIRVASSVASLRYVLCACVLIAALY